ncbi:MAG: FtsX-like permease family protein [Betaproteobacteria bacterium]|nr:MAG: FtsX-like permease family protein [Betaproteobacteria bacterium]
MLLLALRLFARDWRAGEMRILFVALIIAVASVTTVSFFAERVGRAIVRESSQLLGGDLVIVSDRPIDAAYAQMAGRSGLQTSSSVRFRSMTQFANDSLLTAVKAVGPGYPLRGHLRIKTASDRVDVKPDAIPQSGRVWVDARLMRRLRLSLGDQITLGERRFNVAAIVSEEPESSAGFLNLSPRLIFNEQDLASTGLIVPGSRVRYRLYVAGEESAVAGFREFADARIQPGQRIETIRDARPEIRSGLERAERFLGLSTLLTVVLAGVAIALAARRHMQRHFDACAMMRCLGSVQGELLALYGLQFLLAGTIAALIGSFVGLGLQQILVAILAPLVQVQLPPPALWPMLQGFATGCILLGGFALPPLIALRKVSTMRVLRRDLGVPDPTGLSAYLLGGLAIALLILWQAGDLDLGWTVLAGVFATLLACAAITLLAIRLLRRVFSDAQFGWRTGLANIRRRSMGSVLQVSAIGLGLLSLILLTLVRNDLLTSWQRTLPADAPNRFLVNIQTDQIEELRDYFSQHGRAFPALYPMVRGRLVEINGEAVVADDYLDERAKRLVNREFNLSWRGSLYQDNRIVEGRWFENSDQGKGMISMETGIAETLGLELGDVMRYDVAGDILEVEISSLREVQWDSFRVNFFVLAAPGLLDSYPMSWVTSFYLPPGQGEFLDDLIRQFPGFLVIDVEAVLGQVVRMMDQVIRAVEFVFIFSLIAGALVLLAAIASTHDERRMDAAVMRTLGATSRQLRLLQISEFVFIGGVAGLLAAVGATAVGWGLAEKVLGIPYQINPAVWIAGLVAGVLIVTLVGVAGTNRLMRTPPMEVFRTLA